MFDTREMTQDLNQLTHAKVVDMLYQQTPRLVLAHPLGASIFVYTFFGVADTSLLVMWLALIGLYVAIRFASYLAYRSRQDSLSYSQKIRWKYLWVALSTVNGVLYTVAFIYFLPLDEPVYVIAIGLFTISLISTAAIAYGFSLAAVYAFSVTILVPVSAYLMIYGDKAGLIAGMVICMFAANMFTVANSISRAFKTSIRLNHEYQQEIEERKRIEHQLYEVSRRDSLTGLFNRRYFDEILAQEIGRAYRNHTPLSLLIIDIDHFKEYNDHYGHVAGDHCLIDIAHLLNSMLNRKGDIMARYGGEEFACVLPNIDAKGAFTYAEKLQLYVQEQRIEHKGSKLTFLQSITISVGVTTLPLFSRLSASELVQRADRALYQAKKQGRNRVKYYEDLDFDQDKV